MRIWQIIAADGGDWVHYFEPTKKTADIKARELRAAGYELIEVKPEIIDTSRVGLAKKMQNMIDRFCLNEH